MGGKAAFSFVMVSKGQEAARLSPGTLNPHPPHPRFPAPRSPGWGNPPASAPPHRPALLRRSPPAPTPLCSAVLGVGRGPGAARGSGALAPAASADMSGPRAGFYRQELNKTVWEVPQRLQGLRPVGSGAYGSVW